MACSCYTASLNSRRKVVEQTSRTSGGGMADRNASFWAPKELTCLPAGKVSLGYRSSASYSSDSRHRMRASSTVLAVNAIQSRERQAAVMPSKDTRSRVGLYPTTPLRPAGTRPDPAVSVASEKVAYRDVSKCTSTSQDHGEPTRSAPTLTQLPLLLPPEMHLTPNTDCVTPKGLLHPLSPVAN